jgi:hypothetical protein
MNVVASGTAGRNTASHPEQATSEPVNIYGHHVPQTSASASAFSFISSNSSEAAQHSNAHDSTSDSGMTSSFSFISAAAPDPPPHHNTAPSTPVTTSAFSFVSAAAATPEASAAPPPFSPQTLPPKYTPNGGAAVVPHSEAQPVAETPAAAGDNKQTIVHKPGSAAPVALPGIHVSYFVFCHIWLWVQVALCVCAMKCFVAPQSPCEVAGVMVMCTNKIESVVVRCTCM